MVSARMRRWVLAARYVQGIAAVAACIACASAADFWYGAAINRDIYTTAAAFEGAVIFGAAIGMFAFYRPRDVHWHLVFVSDMLCLSLSVTAFLLNAVMTGLSATAYYSDEALPASLTAAVIGILVACPSILTITQTKALWLHARGGDSGKHDWFHMVPPENRPNVLIRPGYRTEGITTSPLESHDGI